MQQEKDALNKILPISLSEKFSSLNLSNFDISGGNTPSIPESSVHRVGATIEVFDESLS